MAAVRVELSDSAVLIVMSGADVGRVHALREDSIAEASPRIVLGRGEECDITIPDGEVSREHAAIERRPEGYFIRDLESYNGTTVNEEPVTGWCRLDRGDLIRMGNKIVCRFTSMDSAEASFAKELHDAILQDSLTGLFNRRYLDDRLAREMAFASRHKIPMSMLMIDLDHFKSINDRYGHRAGDSVLQHVARLVRHTVRVDDVVARYGGEELAVVCRHTDEPNATVLAERLREVIGAEPAWWEGQAVAVTVSIGVAGSLENQATTSGALIDAADNALYRAKHGGRNCWRAASTFPPASDDGEALSQF